MRADRVPSTRLFFFACVRALSASRPATYAQQPWCGLPYSLVMPMHDIVSIGGHALAGRNRPREQTRTRVCFLFLFSCTPHSPPLPPSLTHTSQGNPYLLVYNTVLTVGWCVGVMRRRGTQCGKTPIGAGLQCPALVSSRCASTASRAPSLPPRLIFFSMLSMPHATKPGRTSSS